MSVKIHSIDEHTRRRFAAETKGAESEFVMMFDEPDPEKDLVDLLEEQPKVVRRLA
jgi:hypothetical protein